MVQNHAMEYCPGETQGLGEDLTQYAQFHDTIDTLDCEDFDIDTPVAFIEANLNNVQGRPRPVQMGYDKWSKLSSEEKSTWNKISVKSKRIIQGTSHGTAVQDPGSYNPLNNRLMPPILMKTK